MKNKTEYFAGAKRQISLYAVYGALVRLIPIFPDVGFDVKGN